MRMVTMAGKEVLNGSLPCSLDIKVCWEEMNANSLCCNPSLALK